MAIKNRFAPALQALDAREVPAVLFQTLPDAPVGDTAPTSDTAEVREMGADTGGTDGVWVGFGDTGESEGDSLKTSKKV